MNKIDVLKKIRVLHSAPVTLCFVSFDGQYFEITNGKASKVTKSDVLKRPEVMLLKIATGPFECGPDCVQVPTSSDAYGLINFFAKDLKAPLRPSMLDVPIMKYKHLNNIKDETSNN